MLRLISCQRATLLLEQQTDASLPFQERNSLWLHLRYCPLCRRYAAQTALLNQLARAPIQLGDTPAGLSAAARQRLQAQVLRAQADLEGNT